MERDETRSVIVVGGGLAGLASATILAEHGHRVTVYESEKFLGGRAGAWTETLRDGTHFEMERGFHAFFRNYANVRALLRRRAPQALDEAVEVSGLVLDPATRRSTRVIDGGVREAKAGPTEFRLLHFLMTHPERVHSRAQLLDRVWGDHVFIEERTVDVHIKRLREALEPVASAGMIETVRGAGYRLVTTRE